jgi:hypothetical protein
MKREMGGDAVMQFHSAEFLTVQRLSWDILGVLGEDVSRKGR